MEKKRKRKPKRDDKEQSQRFVETARQLEADESGKAFEQAFRQIKKATGDSDSSG